MANRTVKDFEREPIVKEERKIVSYDIMKTERHHRTEHTRMQIRRSNMEEDARESFRQRV